MNSPFRGLKRSGNQSYPYPRTHTPVMVFRNSTRPVVMQNSPDSSPNSFSRITLMSPNDIKKTYLPKRRPPLNWAIPTIPESLSDESIKSLFTEKNDEMGNLIFTSSNEKTNIPTIMKIDTITKEDYKEQISTLLNNDYNDYDKKNNNFVDKLKITKIFRKHQKNKSLDETEKIKNSKGSTQIPILKKKKFLKNKTKKYNDTDDENFITNSNSEISSPKLLEKNSLIISRPNQSNSILSKSPLTLMAQKFRNKNRRFKEPIHNSSTNVNGSASMDFKDSMLPKNLNDFSESIKRSQSLEVETGIYFPTELSIFDKIRNPNLMNNPIYNDISGQISEFYAKKVSNEEQEKLLEIIDEKKTCDDYMCISSTEEIHGNSDSNNSPHNDSNIENEKFSVDKNSNKYVRNQDDVLTKENIDSLEDTSVEENIQLIDRNEDYNIDSQQSTSKELSHKKNIKSLITNKFNKHSKIKNEINKELPKACSMAEFESKLYLENSMNRPLNIPTNFGKSLNEEKKETITDEKLLSCIETYAPLSYKVKEVICEENINNDNLCAINIPKVDKNIEKFSITLKETYCKPYMVKVKEVPECVKKCSVIKEDLIEQININIKDNILYKSNKEIEGGDMKNIVKIFEEYSKNPCFDKKNIVDNALNFVSTINVTTNNITQEQNKNFKIIKPEHTEVSKNDDTSEKDENFSIKKNLNMEKIKEKIYYNIDHLSSNCESSNEAIFSASINSLSSSLNDISIDMSLEQSKGNTKEIIPSVPLSEPPEDIELLKREDNESKLLVESVVLDNVIHPTFIKSTYIPMIEDSIEGESDIIEDKICKSGDGFKLDINSTSHNTHNDIFTPIKSYNNISQTPSKRLNLISPYENIVVDKNYEDNSIKASKYKCKSRKPSKQFFSFFSKGRKKHKKMQESNFEEKIKKAPLAQSECTRIANSPMVETPPISLIQKNCKTITDDVICAVPAAVKEEEYLTPKTPRSRANADSSAGLIDDELNDQPMLIGNSYSMNNLGSISSFQMEHFGSDEEFSNDLINKSVSAVSNSINNNELYVFGNKGMAKSITDALIANNLKEEELTEKIITIDEIDTTKEDKDVIQNMETKTFNMADDETSDNSYNSGKENHVIKNNNEGNVLKCTENEESRVEIKKVEVENQTFAFGNHTLHQSMNFSNKSCEITNFNSIIKQLKLENKNLKEIIREKDNEINMLKEKLSIFIST
uniref:Non-specific serine/threonine protein kinase n=1 Tax=Parastrongyloides trichosuri TaxID=131310 RepID=A0A0N4ZHK1_PARTI